jgi:hypothetical protein
MVARKTGLKSIPGAIRKKTDALALRLPHKNQTPMNTLMFIHLIHFYIQDTYRIRVWILKYMAHILTRKNAHYAQNVSIIHQDILSRFTRYIILLPFTVITNTLIADR